MDIFFPANFWLILNLKYLKKKHSCISAKYLLIKKKITFFFSNLFGITFLKCLYLRWINKEGFSVHILVYIFDNICIVHIHISIFFIVKFHFLNLTYSFSNLMNLDAEPLTLLTINMWAMYVRWWVKCSEILWSQKSWMF